VPLGHDGYLKLWALGRPRLAVDHIFLDEAQDTNPLVLDLLRRQDAQLVAVGDPYQRIYAWRGAVDLMAAPAAGRTAHLTRSFRFGPAIAAAANAVIAALGEPRRLEGNPAVTSRVGRCAPDAIVARTNAGVVDAVLDALTIGERPHVVGGTAELQRLLAGVAALKDGEGSAVSELAGFATWAEVQDAGRDAASGLRTLVALVEEYGEDRLLGALTRVERDEARADVVVTTAHRAKGREWDRVQLRDDFARGADGVVDPAEARLLYVALTRARRAVDVPDVLLDGLVLDAAAEVAGRSNGTVIPAKGGTQDYATHYRSS
jgi:superfamily I DNA/RNA helicase